MKLMKPMFIRIAMGMIILAFFVVIAGFGYSYYLRARGVPDYNRTVLHEGLHSEVTVYRDRYAVPHIYAADEHDCYFATGYCMAQDRLWQMDLIRRVTEGRLAEIFGDDMVRVDHLFRALRISRKSQEILDRSDPHVVASLQAFADGVNLYLAQHADSLSFEFTVLGYRPEPWKPIHSVNLIGYMGWDLTMPWSVEILYRAIRAKVGEERFREIVPDIGATASSIYARAQHDTVEGFALLEDSLGLKSLGLSVFNASNNWAVSGRRSVTGKPLLANDMHLGFSSPGIWYQMHQCVRHKGAREDSLNVTGVAVPGQPFIISGHNETIAWGMTNVMLDDMDFFEERIDPSRPDRYFYKGEWREMEIVKEKIPVKGGKVVEKTIRYTVHGPVISEFKDLQNEAITMHWGGSYFSNEVQSMYLLNHAENFGDFREALRTFRALGQNIAYADVWGNIGLVCAAGIPIRKKGNGLNVVPGWTDEYEWAGFVPYEQQPILYNPPNNMVLSANNKTSSAFPHHISLWYYPPYRYERIKEMILDKEKLATADFIAMQADTTSLLVRKIKPIIIAVVEKERNLNDLERESLEILRDWDNNLRKDSAAAALFEYWFLEFVTMTFREAMGARLFEQFTAQNWNMLYAVEQVLRNPQSLWFDNPATSGRETRDNVIIAGFRAAVSRLQSTFSGNTRRWRWGEVHRLSLTHPLGKVRILDVLFGLNRGPYETAGSFHTVCPYSYHLNNPFVVTDGASQRHVYDLADWDNSYAVIPTGNAGIPGSAHYCDQTELYLAGRYHRDLFSKEMVKKHSVYQMKFKNQ